MRSCLIPLVAFLVIAAPLQAQRQTESSESPAWRLLGTKNFPKGYGSSIAYRSEGGATATIYIYDLELTEIPSGTASRIIRDELARCRDEVQVFWKEKGWTVRELSQQVVGLGSAEDAPRMVRVSYEFEKDGTVQTNSHLYLMGYNNKFFKIRVSFPTDNQSVCETEIAALLNIIAEKLSD